MSPFKLEGLGEDNDGGHLKMIKLFGPQVSGGSASVSDGTAGIEITGNTATDTFSQGHVIWGTDIENNWQHGVRCIENGNENFINMITKPSNREYDVYFGSNNNFGMCQIPVTYYSDSANNMIFGNVLSVDGTRISGFVQSNEESGITTHYTGISNLGGINFTSTSTKFNGNAMLDGTEGARFEWLYLRLNAGSEVGELRRHNGDERLYEWDGSAWQRVTISYTITPS